MKTTGLSRRQMLKLMSLGAGAYALDNLGPIYPALAQQGDAGSAYAEDVALTAAEIVRVRAANLRFAFNVDQGNTGFSQAIVFMARRAATQYGILVDVANSANNASVQATTMNAQIKLEYDGIFTLAVDTDALADPLEQANQAKIPVVMTGGQPPRGQLLAQMNSTHYLGCYQATSALIKAAGGSGKIAVLSSGLALSIFRDGERGALQAISESDMELADLVAVTDEPAAEAAVEALLEAHPDLTAIFSTWGEALDGTLVAAAEAPNPVRVAGFGAEVDSFSAFAANNSALVAVSAERAGVIGRAAVNVLCRGYLGTPVASSYVVPTTMVDAMNFRERWTEIYPNLRAPWE